MKILLPAALASAVLALAPPGAAQDDAKTGLATYQQLVKDYQAAQATFRKESTTVRRSDAFQQATAEFNAARKANDDDAAAAAIAKRNALMASIEPVDPAPFIESFQALAEQHNGTEVGAKSLLWIAQNARTDRDAVKAAVASLVADHLACEQEITALASMAGRFTRTLGEEATAALLDTLIEKGPSDAVKANAYFARAGTKKAGRDMTAAAVADYEKAATFAKGSPLEKRAKAAIFEGTRLKIGVEAPDIVGEDLDGVEFKLSDYRGKVVVLDFWGDW